VSEREVGLLVGRTLRGMSSEHLDHIVPQFGAAFADDPGALRCGCCTGPSITALGKQVKKPVPLPHVGVHARSGSIKNTGPNASTYWRSSPRIECALFVWGWPRVVFQLRGHSRAAPRRREINHFASLPRSSHRLPRRGRGRSQMPEAETSPNGFWKAGPHSRAGALQLASIRTRTCICHTSRETVNYYNVTAIWMLNAAVRQSSKSGCRTSCRTKWGVAPTSLLRPRRESER
jgi:hypothetical protein